MPREVHALALVKKKKLWIPETKKGGPQFPGEEIGLLVSRMARPDYLSLPCSTPKQSLHVFPEKQCGILVKLLVKVWNVSVRGVSN